MKKIERRRLPEGVVAMLTKRVTSTVRKLLLGHPARLLAMGWTVQELVSAIHSMGIHRHIRHAHV